MSFQPQLPKQGELVEVRRRRYVVVDIAQNMLPTDVLAPTLFQQQNMVMLSSVEDDALGEELQVIWEIEPGARILEDSHLPQPTSFDTPQCLDTFLNAVRWGAASSADVRALQAPFRSGIDLEDYQLDPVARAIQMPRANLLIADDVGLGKTIEAGLVAQELIIRHRARRRAIRKALRQYHSDRKQVQRMGFWTLLERRQTTPGRNDAPFTGQRRTDLGKLQYREHPARLGRARHPVLSHPGI